MWVLGINWKWHDAAAALVDGGGRVWAFAEEERSTRVRHAWDTHAAGAARLALDTAGITWRDLSAVALGWDLPRMFPWDDSCRERLYTALFGAEAARATRPELVFVDHHLAHARSTFHASGFERAAVLVVDGSGELDAMSVFSADAAGLTPRRRWPRAHSLGAMYEAITRLLGFGRLDAGRTMGLAPYGRAGDVPSLPAGDLAGDGGTPFDLPPTVGYPELTDRWARELAGRFGTVVRPAPELDRDPVAVRLAAGGQRTVEEAMSRLHAEAVRLAGASNVCLAGGVALNCVANGLLPEPLYVPPFAHDAGVAVGAAWELCPPAQRELLPSPYLGADLRTGRLPDTEGLRVTDLSLATVVDLLAGGAMGAVIEGRSEVGPRALGHRSIVALPRPAGVRDRINALKGRERWRPLAPVTLAGYAPRLWPGQGLRERYMVGTAAVTDLAGEVMPAAVHVDGTTRPQSLHGGESPVVEGLLRGLRNAGLPPVLVNTSCNGPGEPIVDTAADAVRAFRELGLDFLVLGDLLIRRPRDDS